MNDGSDLSTRYLGLELHSPIVASASPLTGKPDTAQQIAHAGAAAIVLPSLFEEEILHEEVDLNLALETGSEHFAEALDYFPDVDDLKTASDRYLSRLQEIKRRIDVPVIASLNATTTGGWVRYARLIEEAGADALELNLYRLAADPESTASEIEDADVGLLSDVRAEINIPLAVKLSPYYTALANFARRVAGAGGDGLVLFNRFYQPDLDPDNREVVPRIDLSQPWELRLPLRWIAMLRPVVGHGVSLAATSGVHSARDVVKALLVGADVAMMTSALLHHGPQHVREVESELRSWMVEHEYKSVSQLRGSVSYAASDDPSAFERVNYLRTLHSWNAPIRLTPQSPSWRD